jgi:hypothetical protein
MDRTISRRDFLNGVGARHNTLDVGSTIPIEVLRGGQIIHSMITTTSLRPTLRGNMRRMSLSPARLTP